MIIIFVTVILKTAHFFHWYSRWYGGLGLAGLAFLVNILMLLAVCCGILGGNADVAPSERSKLSNSGGNLLLAYVPTC